MMRLIRLACGLSLIALLPGRIEASDLAGGTAAARPSAKTASTNPAHAATLPRSTFEASPTLFQSETIRARYVGADPVVRSNSGVGNILSFSPALIWKPNAKLGVGITEIIPPITLELDPIRKVPLNILGQVNYVDLVVKAKPKGGLGGLVGYELSDNFAVGVKAGFRSIGAEVDARSSDSGASIATILIDDFSLDVEAGFTWTVIPDKFTVGASTGVFSMRQSEQAVSSPLLGAAGGAAGEGAGEGGSKSSAGVPLSGVLIGTEFQFSPLSRLWLDLDWKRAAPSKAFSLVELREKDKDVYDTLSVRVGTALDVLPNGGSLLAGFRYEPSPIGPGGTGEGSRTGFGSLDTAQIFAGQGELRPSWSLAGGARFGFGRPLRSLDDKERARVRRSRKSGPSGQAAANLTTYTLGAGLAWQSASLGIDEAGELPGAFTQTRLSVPVEFSWRF
jgi:hypothetical protein